MRSVFDRVSIGFLILVVISTLSLLPRPAAARSGKAGVLVALVGVMVDTLAFFQDSIQNEKINNGDGAKVEQRLLSMQTDLEREIRVVDAGNTQDLQELRAQLETVTTQLTMVRKFLREQPTREEIKSFQAQTRLDLDRLFSAIGEQGDLLQSHESQIQELRRRLQELERIFGLVPSVKDGVANGELPEEPRVAVLVLGEPTFANAVETELESRLLALDVDAASGRSSYRVNDFLYQYGDQTPLGDLAPLLVADGFHVLVLGRVEVVGYRELNYFGRRSEATNARLRLDTFLLHGQRPLGRGMSEAVEYTLLNAETRAEQTLRGLSPGLAEAIQQGWRAQRERLGG